MCAEKTFQMYLLYGENEVEINKKRLSIIDSLLSTEEKNANLTEFEPPSGKLFPLSSAASKLMADLSSLSLLSDSRRVAVIYNLESFFTSSKAKKETEDYFIAFLDKELSGTNNAVVFICYPDFEKNRAMNLKGGLYQLVSAKGYVEELKETPILWQIEPLILQRNVSETIAVFRDWLKKDYMAPRKLFNLLIKIVAVLIQMNIYNEKKGDFARDSKLEGKFFPAKMTNNIKKINPYVLKRFEKAAHLFSIKRLNWANARLLEMNKVVFPQTSDPYVADVVDTLEVFLLKFLSVEEGDT